MDYKLNYTRWLFGVLGGIGVRLNVNGVRELRIKNRKIKFVVIFKR